MPTIKYVFLPFLWSLLPGMSPYLPNNLGLLSPISATNKQYFSEIVMQHPSKKGSLYIPQVGPFPWKNPYRISFIEMQAASAKDQTDEATGPLKSIIPYQGQDSITFDVEQKNFNIYGAGTIGYEDAQLTAENISLNWAKHTIIATGKKNELGKIDPKPVFEQGKNKYIAEEIRYNFESKRGTARNLFTKQDEALIRSHKAKMDTQDTYYADQVELTTCNLTKPHYFIQARNVKFVKDKKVASGPFQFYFDGVPTILGFFYGLFYMPTAKTSGIIRPQIGEDGERGFFLKEGGYYFYFNDYIDLALRGSLYAKGHSQFSANINYKKRYGYTGTALYTRGITNQTAETALQETKEKEWRFQWKHNTENNRVSSLTAEVDIESRSPRHALETRDKPDQLNAKTQSQIRYMRKLLGTPYTLNTSVKHSKDFPKNLTHITFPQVMLGTIPIYPFRWRSGASRHWYEDIYFKHTSEFQNELTNVVHRDTLDFTRQNWSKFLKESRYGAKHAFPVETNIKLFTYFNLKPFFNYIERWYFKRLDYRYDAAKDSILADTISSFKRVWDYNLGAELKTTIYGTHLFNEESSVQGVRHRIEPSIDITYTPDFSKEKFGYWQKIQTKHKQEVLDKFQLGVYGTPKNKASAVLNVKVDNTLELKVKNTKDASAKSKKIPVFESLHVGTTYDFLADSFPLGDINLNARTRLLDSLISLEYTSTYEPYIYRGRSRIEEFAWEHGQGLGTLKKYTFKIGTTLKSKKSSKETGDQWDSKSTKKALVEDSDDEETASVISLDSTQYVDFNIPWQLTLTYRQNYTYDIPKDKKETTRQLEFSGDLTITNNWKIGFGSTYDLDKKELVGSATKLNIYRDLHCWQMSFDWYPLANKQSYEFSIGIKAPVFQDLKYPHSRSYDKV